MKSGAEGGLFPRRGPDSQPEITGFARRSCRVGPKRPSDTTNRGGAGSRMVAVCRKALSSRGCREGI
jgi:hypothetical protein